MWKEDPEMACLLSLMHPENGTALLEVPMGLNSGSPPRNHATAKTGVTAQNSNSSPGWFLINSQEPSLWPVLSSPHT